MNLTNFWYEQQMNLATQNLPKSAIIRCETVKTFSAFIHLPAANILSRLIAFGKALGIPLSTHCCRHSLPVFPVTGVGEVRCTSQSYVNISCVSEAVVSAHSSCKSATT